MSKRNKISSIPGNLVPLGSQNSRGPPKKLKRLDGKNTFHSSSRSSSPSLRGSGLNRGSKRLVSFPSISKEGEATVKRLLSLNTKKQKNAFRDEVLKLIVQLTGPTASVHGATLLELSKQTPGIFRDEKLRNALVMSLKTTYPRGRIPYAPAVASRLFWKAYEPIDSWPLEFVHAFIEDICAEISCWTNPEQQHADTKSFVTSIRSIFTVQTCDDDGDASKSEKESKAPPRQLLGNKRKAPSSGEELIDNKIRKRSKTSSSNQTSPQSSSDCKTQKQSQEDSQISRYTPSQGRIIETKIVEILQVSLSSATGSSHRYTAQSTVKNVGTSLGNAVRLAAIAVQLRSVRMLMCQHLSLWLPLHQNSRSVQALLQSIVLFLQDSQVEDSTKDCALLDCLIDQFMALSSSSIQNLLLDALSHATIKSIPSTPILWFHALNTYLNLTFKELSQPLAQSSSAGAGTGAVEFKQVRNARLQILRRLLDSLLKVGTKHHGGLEMQLAHFFLSVVDRNNSLVLIQSILRRAFALFPSSPGSSSSSSSSSSDSKTVVFDPSRFAKALLDTQKASIAPKFFQKQLLPQSKHYCVVALISLLTGSCLQGALPAVSLYSRYQDLKRSSIHQPNVVQKRNILLQQHDNAVREWRMQVAHIHTMAMIWIHTFVCKYLPNANIINIINQVLVIGLPNPVNMLVSAYQTSEWPPWSVASLVPCAELLSKPLPLLEDGLTRLVLICLTDKRIPAHSALPLIEDVVDRACRLCMIPGYSKIALRITNPQLMEAILQIAKFQLPPAVPPTSIPKGPSLAITEWFWRACIVLTLLSSFNCDPLISAACDQIPVLRRFFEMLITDRLQQFHPPDDTTQYAQRINTLLQAKLEDETKRILELENLLPDNQPPKGNSRTETTSLFIKNSHLILLDPSECMRLPPQRILQSLAWRNRTFKLGSLLRQCTTPNLLATILKREKPELYMLWLIPVVLKDAMAVIPKLPQEATYELLILSTQAWRSKSMNTISSTLSSSLISISGDKKSRIFPRTNGLGLNFEQELSLVSYIPLLLNQLPHLSGSKASKASAADASVERIPVLSVFQLLLGALTHSSEQRRQAAKDILCLFYLRENTSFPFCFQDLEKTSPDNFLNQYDSHDNRYYAGHRAWLSFLSPEFWINFYQIHGHQSTLQILQLFDSSIMQCILYEDETICLKAFFVFLTQTHSIIASSLQPTIFPSDENGTTQHEKVLRFALWISGFSKNHKRFRLLINSTIDDSKLASKGHSVFAIIAHVFACMYRHFCDSDSDDAINTRSALVDSKQTVTLSRSWSETTIHNIPKLFLEGIMALLAVPIPSFVKRDRNITADLTLLLSTLLPDSLTTLTVSFLFGESPSYSSGSKDTQGYMTTLKTQDGSTEPLLAQPLARSLLVNHCSNPETPAPLPLLTLCLCRLGESELLDILRTHGSALNQTGLILLLEAFEKKANDSSLTDTQKKAARKVLRRTADFYGAKNSIELGCIRVNDLLAPTLKLDQSTHPLPVSNPFSLRSLKHRKSRTSRIGRATNAYAASSNNQSFHDLIVAYLTDSSPLSLDMIFNTRKVEIVAILQLLNPQALYGHALIQSWARQEGNQKILSLLVSNSHRCLRLLHYCLRLHGSGLVESFSEQSIQLEGNILGLFETIINWCLYSSPTAHVISDQDLVEWHTFQDILISLRNTLLAHILDNIQCSGMEDIPPSLLRTLLCFDGKDSSNFNLRERTNRKIATFSSSAFDLPRVKFLLLSTIQHTGLQIGLHRLVTWHPSCRSTPLELYYQLITPLTSPHEHFLINDHKNNGDDGGGSPSADPASIMQKVISTLLKPSHWHRCRALATPLLSYLSSATHVLDGCSPNGSIFTESVVAITEIPTKHIRGLVADITNVAPIDYILGAGRSKSLVFKAFSIGVEPLSAFSLKNSGVEIMGNRAFRSNLFHSSNWSSLHRSLQVLLSGRMMNRIKLQISQPRLSASNLSPPNDKASTQPLSWQIDCTRVLDFVSACLRHPRSSMAFAQDLFSFYHSQSQSHLSKRITTSESFSSSSATSSPSSLSISDLSLLFRFTPSTTKTLLSLIVCERLEQTKHIMSNAMERDGTHLRDSLLSEAISHAPSNLDAALEFLSTLSSSAAHVQAASISFSVLMNIFCAFPSRVRALYPILSNPAPKQSMRVDLDLIQSNSIPVLEQKHSQRSNNQFKQSLAISNLDRCILSALNRLSNKASSPQSFVSFRQLCLSFPALVLRYLPFLTTLIEARVYDSIDHLVGTRGDRLLVYIIDICRSLVPHIIYLPQLVGLIKLYLEFLANVCHYYHKKTDRGLERLSILVSKLCSFLPDCLDNQELLLYLVSPFVKQLLAKLAEIFPGMDALKKLIILLNESSSHEQCFANLPAETRAAAQFRQSLAKLETKLDQVQPTNAHNPVFQALRRVQSHVTALQEAELLKVAIAPMLRAFEIPDRRIRGIAAKLLLRIMQYLPDVIDVIMSHFLHHLQSSPAFGTAPAVRTSETSSLLAAFELSIDLAPQFFLFAGKLQDSIFAALVELGPPAIPALQKIILHSLEG